MTTLSAGLQKYQMDYLLIDNEISLQGLVIIRQKKSQV